MSPTKSPKSQQKSLIDARGRDALELYATAVSYSKEPCSNAKEPCVSTKEPCKEPYISAKEPYQRTRTRRARIARHCCEKSFIDLIYIHETLLQRHIGLICGDIQGSFAETYRAHLWRFIRLFCVDV